MSLYGIITVENNFTYEGQIVNRMAHGHGTYHYNNGDWYTGSCKFGLADGFGTYKYGAGKGVYTGYFSCGKHHGIGTFEDNYNIYKGSWRNDHKHGMFYRTHKPSCTTYHQKWLRNRLVSNVPVQYIRPEVLRTTKNNPKKSVKKMQALYKGGDRKCVMCLDKCVNATNTGCGHVVACYECLNQCDRCPICRAYKKEIIRLFVN